ncbi:unnamed protein product [Caenorhabditis angaria]|uniref:Protein CASC3 n=1 Tax=Caenorhabditis angaria TaxID=860376 RepID=A0A9P1I4U8_9PELO|nr:unnamed protein product [Caenorhabditis angaria]
MAEDAEVAKVEEKKVEAESNENVEERPAEEKKVVEENAEPAKATVSDEKKEGNEPAQKNEDSETVENSAELDDDQQVENPAYIPKVGKFYMHDDDRRGEEVDGNLDSDDANDKKKSRADGLWKHDRFDEKFQRPKSKKQIVKKYGCDIRSDQKDGDASVEKETTAPESTEDDSDVKQVRQNRKDRKINTRPTNSRNAPTNRRRPMKKREREDTVDESNTEVEEKPAQRRNIQNNASKPQKKPVSRSSEEDEEEDDGGEIKKGQRRNQGPRSGTGIRRGFGGTTRLRGRVTQVAPRRHNPPSSSSYRNDVRDNDTSKPQQQQTHQQNASIPVRRFRGGVSRGGFTSRGSINSYYESNYRTRGSTRTPRDYNTSNSSRQINDDRFENHRRGVIRGGGFVRGSSIRGAPAPIHRGRNTTSRGGFVSRTDTSEQSDGYQRDFPPPVPARGAYRGGYNNNNNNSPVPRNASFPQRGGYTNGNDRGGYNHHNHQPKVYSQPPIQQTIVVPTNVPPPQMTRGTTHGGAVIPQQQQQQQRIRQPTDVVYFDPVQQQVNRAPVQSRVKKVIPIVDPNTNK